MFESVGLQNLLMIFGAIVLTAVIIFVAYRLLRHALAHRVATGLVLAGLLPGLLIGYFANSISLPALPTFEKTPAKPMSPTSITLKLDPPTSEERPVLPESDDQAASEPDETITDPGDDEAEEIDSAEKTERDEQGVAEEPAPTPNVELIDTDNMTSPSVEDDSESSVEVAAEQTEPAPQEPAANAEAVAEEGPEEPQVAFLPRRNPFDPEMKAVDEEVDRRLQDANDYIDLALLMLEDHPGGAITYLNKALPLYEELELYPQAAQTLHNLGYAHLKVGELVEAQRFTLAALKVAKDLGDQHITVNALINLGFVHMNKNDPDNALIYYNEALTLANPQGSSRSLATLLQNIGLAHAAKGDTGQAIEHLENAKNIASEVGDEPLVESISTSLNQLYAVTNP